MEYFRERQRFTQWWLWALLLLAPAIALVVPMLASFKGEDALLINVLVTVPIVLFMASLHLDTSISDEGIRYRFFPFHLKEHLIPWSDIQAAYVRKYKPIAEYGGWGIRGLFGDGAYNVRGNIGLQLELKNGKKLLLGTQQGPMIEEVLAQRTSSGL